MLTGESGILKQAQTAREKTDIASAVESAQTEMLEEMIKNGGEDLSRGTLKGILDKYFDGVPDTDNSVWDAFPEGFPELKVKDTDYTVKMSEIYEGTIGGQGAGEKTAMPEGKTWNTEIVTPITDGEGNVIPVPKDFYYAGGTKNTGFVISDVEGDDLDNSKGGNQFVWVPCGEGEEVVYEKTKGLATTWKSKYSEKQYWYLSEGSGTAGTKIDETDWDDEGGDENSVSTYGGFYIGRFEAGIPSEAPFYGAIDGATYNITGRGNQSETTKVAGLKPVNKKNNPSWNFITQANAVTVSKSMYSNSLSVTSSLIDSYAWDTTVEWIQTGSGAVSKVTDSTNYGNYNNNTGISLASSGLYAMHAYSSVRINGKYWLYATKYSVGNWGRTTSNKQITEGNKDTDYSKYEWSTEKSKWDFSTNTYNERTEIATGASETTKTKNIYDLAGNMWEWTTEIREHNTSTSTSNNTTYAVSRGGGFHNGATWSTTLCARDGSATLGGVWVTQGFRVVLYVKI